MADGLALQTLSIDLAGRILVSLDTCVAPGETLTLMGPSGIGKSTVLAAITGTLARDFAMQGRILLDGRDITDLPPEQRHVGILFQDEMLFPHLSVGGNLAFGLPPGPNRREKVEAALAEIGLDGFADRDPGTLSGGQKARVALMRMLLSEPRALLLDEPFSKLDAELRTATRKTVFDKAKDRGLPVLLVTHDRADAEAANGRIIELGTPS